MKTKKTYFSRQLRQLKFLSKRLNRLVKSGEFYQLSFSQQQKQIQKFKKLIQNLESSFSAAYLRKVTVGTALILGLGVGTSSLQGQTFAEPIINPFNFVPHTEVTLGFTFAGVADLDADGDMDLLVNYYYYGLDLEGPSDHQIGVFYENIGTISNPDFGSTPIVAAFALDTLCENSITLDLVDIDNDGDYDLFAGVENVGLDFYENIGTPTEAVFSESVTNPMGFINPHGANHPEFADLDNDGDLDLLLATFYDSNLYFYENIGTPEEAAFAFPQENPLGINLDVPNDYSALHQLADLDNDGDLDLLFTSMTYNSDEDRFESKLFFQENIGTPTSPSFGERVENPFAINLPYELVIPVLVDMDNDGDSDLLITGEYYEGTIYYYENTTITSSLIDFPRGTNIIISPNPTTTHLQIEAKFSDGISTVCATVTNTLGQVIEHKNIPLQNGQIQENWNISNWKSGVYFIQFQAEDMSRTIKAIKQ